MDAAEKESNYFAIATVCKTVINDPETHIDALEQIIEGLDTNILEFRQIIMLSLVKVFKNIVPLYKIRTISEKVKFSEETKEISIFDRKLLKIYTNFIKKILLYENDVSYECACLLFESLSHFNCSEKLAIKLIRGTLIDKHREFCIKTLFDGVRNLEVMDKIVHRMTNLKFHPSLLPILEKIEFNEENKKFEKNVTDNIFRIYFSVLKEKENKFYENVLNGIRFYRKKIQQKHLDGLYLMLNNLLKNKTAKIKIMCLKTILVIYGPKDLDFKNVLNSLYELITPFKYKLTYENLESINRIIRLMFLSKRQPKNRSRVFVQRMLQFCNSGPFFIFKETIINLLSSYQIDIKDIQTCGDGIYEIDCENIDINGEKPFYEFDLFRSFKAYK